jgi:hypothetical protein
MSPTRLPLLYPALYFKCQKNQNQINKQPLLPTTLLS